MDFGFPEGAANLDRLLEDASPKWGGEQRQLVVPVQAGPMWSTPTLGLARITAKTADLGAKELAKLRNAIFLDRLNQALGHPISSALRSLPTSPVPPA